MWCLYTERKLAFYAPCALAQVQKLQNVPLHNSFDLADSCRVVRNCFSPRK